MARPRAETLVQHRPQLLAFARRRLRDRAQAEDAVQETLVAAVERIDSFGGSSSLGTWLTGILKHKIVDIVRKSARDQWEEFREDDGSTHAARSPLGDPEEWAGCSSFFERLERYMGELSDRAARVFVLRDVMGMNTAETCRELAISSSNCGVLLHRARSRLRLRLAADGLADGGSG